MTSIKKNNTMPKFEIYENIETSSKSLFTRQDFEQRTIISKIDYEKILNAPDMHSIQIGENQHIIPKPHYLKFMNHSCNPNIFLDLNKMEILALRKIKSGEEIVFFYPSTEWKMTEPFNCSCKSNNCLTRIEGAYNLFPDSSSEYKFSDYVIQKAAAR